MRIDKKPSGTYTYDEIRITNVFDDNITDKRYSYPEIRITGLSKDTIQILGNIAENQGYKTVSKLMMYHIKQKLNSIPAPADETITGREILKKFAKDNGYGTLNNYMKCYIKHIIKCTSPADKQPPDK